MFDSAFILSFYSEPDPVTAPKRAKQINLWRSRRYQLKWVGKHQRCVTYSQKITVTHLWCLT